MTKLTTRILAGLCLAVALGVGGCATTSGPTLPAPIPVELEQEK